MKKPAAAPLAAQLDHLVVAAASLGDGVRWCERVLGVTPGPGGEHGLMGTHNRLLPVASASFPQAYLEIITIHPGAPMSRPPGSRRWFDLDDRELHAHLVQHGPQLIHFIARTANAAAGVQALKGLGLDRGRLIEASRMTPQGLLRWKIAVRDDGQRLFYGTLPTLIEWGDVHPADGMADAGLSLVSVAAHHPRPDALRQAYDAIGLQGIDVTRGQPLLAVRLQTPRGLVSLDSRGV